MKRLILTLALVVCAFCAHAQPPTLYEVIGTYGSFGWLGEYRIAIADDDDYVLNTMSFEMESGQINTFMFDVMAQPCDPIVSSVFYIPNVKLNDWIENLDAQCTKVDYLRWTSEYANHYIQIGSEFFTLWTEYHDKD